MTLTEFLLARIAEDEARNNRAVAEEVERCRADGIPDMTEQEIRDLWGGQRWWRRRLAEREAKQRIVDMRDWPGPPEANGYINAILRTLATVYADHPDYREEWKP